MHDYHLNNRSSDLCGYAASALVLATFSMKSMLWPRMTAVASNLAFIFYASITGLHPSLILHCILLPLNVYRLVQIVRSHVAEKRLGGAGLAKSIMSENSQLSRAAGA